jgi:pimeloyl-ACP methyl ester carboxylesterase
MGLNRGATATSVILALTLATAGCTDDDDTTAQPKASATASASAIQDSTTSGAPNRVDVGGRSLQVDCQGSGGPIVVLEAGLTGDLRTWDRVVPRLPTDATVCAYDRANVGASDPAPTPRTASDAAADLEAVLEAVGAGPYVLVGFSFGGLIVQLFAAEHPDDVAGIVLVESNHPDETRQFEEHLTPTQIAEDREQAQANPEGIDVFGSFDEVRAAGTLPAVPLVVVTSTAAGDWPPGWDPAVFDKLRSEQQTDLAQRVPGGTQVFAQGSGHDVPADRPDIVADAIRTVLDRYRAA